MGFARAAELGRIIAAVIKAAAEARTPADRGDLGADVRDLVQDARDLHELALDALGADPEAGKNARGLAGTISNKLAELEAMLPEKAPPGLLH